MTSAAATGVITGPKPRKAAKSKPSTRVKKIRCQKV